MEYREEHETVETGGAEGSAMAVASRELIERCVEECLNCLKLASRCVDSCLADDQAKAMARCIGSAWTARTSARPVSPRSAGTRNTRASSAGCWRTSARRARRSARSSATASCASARKRAGSAPRPAARWHGCGPPPEAGSAGRGGAACRAVPPRVQRRPRESRPAQGRGLTFQLTGRITLSV